MSLTPIQIETKLTALVTEISKAQRALADARNLEVSADITLRETQDALEDDAPKPRRGEVTVAEREAWMDRATRAQWAEWRRATVRRETAQDYLRALLAQSEIVRSLGASVRQAYEMAGAS